MLSANGCGWCRTLAAWLSPRRGRRAGVREGRAWPAMKRTIRRGRGTHPWGGADVAAGADTDPGDGNAERLKHGHER